MAWRCLKTIQRQHNKQNAGIQKHTFHVRFLRPPTSLTEWGGINKHYELRGMEVFAVEFSQNKQTLVRAGKTRFPGRGKGNKYLAMSIRGFGTMDDITLIAWLVRPAIACWTPYFPSVQRRNTCKGIGTTGGIRVHRDLLSPSKCSTQDIGAQETLRYTL